MYRTKQGYIKVQAMGHHRADHNGSVYEHVLIMERYLGRALIPNVDDIHHKNGNKSDNRLENLELLSHGAHLSLSKGKAQVDMSNRICSICQSRETGKQKQKIGIRPHWLYDKVTGILICSRCGHKQRRRIARQMKASPAANKAAAFSSP